MKLYLLLTLAFVAVQLSLADNSQAASMCGEISYPTGEPFHCADCTSWDPKLAQLKGARWLCVKSLPTMQCPVRNYGYCKTYCAGAAKAAPVVHDEYDKN